VLFGDFGEAAVLPCFGAAACKELMFGECPVELMYVLCGARKVYILVGLTELKQQEMGNSAVLCCIPFFALSDVFF